MSGRFLKTLEMVIRDTEPSFCPERLLVDIDNFTDYFPPSTDMRALVLRKPAVTFQKGYGEHGLMFFL